MKHTPLRSLLLYPVLACLWILGLTVPVLAFAAGVTTQYKVAQPLASGTLVSSIPDQPEMVEATTPDNADRVFGAVVDFEESLIALGGQDENSIQVARDGALDVLVSDLGGAIVKGDGLTVSPLAGVAVKAGVEPIIIGTALSDFNGEEDKTIGTAEITAKNGEKKTVKLSKVRVQFEVGANPNIDKLKGRVPGFLQEFGNIVAGKPVSPIRIVAAFLVLLITLIISGVLLFGAIRSSMISIGRNPLSRGAVYKGMIQVFGLVGLVLAAGLGTIYIILKS